MAFQLDPHYDVRFPCPQCAFVARGPGALEDHLLTHEVPAPAPTPAPVPVPVPEPEPEPEPESVPVLSPNAVAAVRVDEVVGPVTEAVQRVGARTYTCGDCGERVAGFALFLRHKVNHKVMGQHA